MITLEQYEAGVREMTRDEAETLTRRIRVAVEGTWELIRDAYMGRVWLALGYESWDAYTDAEFGAARLRLPREDRRDAVASLRDSGLSIRAIASGIGVDTKTVQKDLRAAQVWESPTPPEPAAPPAHPVKVTETIKTESVVDQRTGEVIGNDGLTDTERRERADHYRATAGSPELTDRERDLVADRRGVQTVTGIDGKTYPAAKPREAPTVLRGDAAEQDNAEQTSKALGRALITLLGMTYPAHRDRIITRWWPRGCDAVPPDSRDLYNPQQIRVIADAMHTFADELEEHDHE